MFDIFANSAKKGKGSKNIVLQAHPLDMTAPNRRDAFTAMPKAPQNERHETRTVEMPRIEAPSRELCLNDIFNQILGDEPKFADHVENL